MELIWVVVLCALAALAGAALLYRGILRADPGNERMRELSQAIAHGASAFLSREYRALFWFVVVLALILVIVPDLGWQTALSFVCGAVASGLAGFFGMRTATMANGRTAQAALTDLPAALRVAFSSGAVLGLAVVGLGVLGITGLLALFAWVLHSTLQVTLEQYILGFSLGASSIALFARVGGGIFTKAADVGADLAGKVEEGIPEDDPRNPAVIADNVGDNVGDVAGMGADLFESYVGSIISAMLLGYLALGTQTAVIFPLLLAALGIVASLVGVSYTILFTARHARTALRNGTIAAALVMGVGSFIMVVGYREALGGGVGLAWALIAGLVAGLAIGWLTEYNTSNDYQPTRLVSLSSRTGAATNIISGISLGMLSSAGPLLIIALAILVAYTASGGFLNPVLGLFSIAVAAVGMLSTLGVTLAVDAYGPVVDNAGGIASQAEMPAKVRHITDRLDAAGNTTAAIGKGFAIGSAALTALAFFAAYTVKAGISTIDLTSPIVVISLLIGAMLPFLFSALTLNAVGHAAQLMIAEVRRQFNAIPGLREGKPGVMGDYKTCVDIAAAEAIKRMVLPGLLAVAAPIVVGVVFKYVEIATVGANLPNIAGGAEAVGGMLAGALASGVMIALFMANAGGAWDNAKKYIEQGGLQDELERQYGEDWLEQVVTTVMPADKRRLEGLLEARRAEYAARDEEFGEAELKLVEQEFIRENFGPGSDSHKAAVVGDTVGDPFKDTSGPSLNILIKLMSIVALVFAVLFT